MTHIVQIVPYLTPGAGVPGVAWNLDRAFRELGAEVETFTFDVARNGRPFPYPQTGIAGRLARMRRIMWFRIVGTRRARAYLATRPRAVSICHSEVLAGDVFVDHGSMLLALRAAGRPWWRIFMNPIQPLSYLLERRRFRGRIHDTIVTLTGRGAADLVALYGKVAPSIVTIPNGVDLDRFRPANATVRDRLRAAYGLGDDDRVALFIGHDLPRKGIKHAIAALVHAPEVLLLVVGGVTPTIDAAKELAERLGVAARTLFVGPRDDVDQFFAVADMFVFPSGYETFGLVLLEALACGVPVVATRVGCAPDVVVDGVNGFLVEQDPVQIGARLQELAEANLTPWRTATRSSVEGLTWRHAAQQYLDLASSIERKRRSHG